jgi:5'-nucleotidase
MKIGVVVGGFAIALTASVCGFTHPTQHSVTIKIIALNDFHGSLQAGSYVPVAGEPAVTAGGIDYLAAYVAELKSENPNHVVVSAGDLLGASPLIRVLS